MSWHATVDQAKLHFSFVLGSSPWFPWLKGSSLIVKGSLPAVFPAWLATPRLWQLESWTWLVIRDATQHRCELCSSKHALHNSNCLSAVTAQLVLNPHNHHNAHHHQQPGAQMDTSKMVSRKRRRHTPRETPPQSKTTPAWQSRITKNNQNRQQHTDDTLAQAEGMPTCANVEKTHQFRGETSSMLMLKWENGKCQG